MKLQTTKHCQSHRMGKLNELFGQPSILEDKGDLGVL